MDKASITDLENLASRRGVIIPAFKIYGELAGFYDYGPIGTAIRNRLERYWRSSFIERLGNIEISTTIVAPEKVFEASGHLANFTDPITTCKTCKTAYRSDKLLEEFYEKSKNPKMAEAAKHMQIKELDEEIAKNAIKCQKCGGALSNSEPFNLMLGTTIGPYGGVKGYMRPETAQGIFMDFKQIFRDGGYKLPLAIGQVGKAFRNEISPRRMLIRMREFSQMELEYFFDTEAKALEINGEEISDEMFSETINILTADMQNDASEKEHISMSVSECISKGYVPNKLFGFCIIRELHFMQELGFDKEHIRFRQVLKNELPHYSKANFDMEVNFFGSFEEISGTAYRTNFDLENHQTHSGQDMSIINNDKKLVPHVVEVSFGLDRLFWVLLGESLFMDEKRGWHVLKLNELAAPYDYAIFPLQKDESLRNKGIELRNKLLSEHKTVLYSYTGSIGKRYAKADETGIRFAITIDFQTLEDGTVTIRDSYDATQKRIKLEDIK